jgi:tetratricopeptide (TPR) repeat protein
MAEPGKKLGKLSLAILENFVEGVLGEKFVDELRAPTDREIAITTALGETEKMFVAKYDDKDLAKALFVDMKQSDRPVLGDAVGKYFDHPTDPSLRQSLQEILFDEFKNFLSKERIDTAVDFYIKLLTKELMLKDDVFRDNIASLAIYEGNLSEQRQVELLEQIGEKIVNQQAVAQQAFRSLHQLSPPPADFTGRESLIEELLKDFESHKGATISGLTGMGGIGKTALGLIIADQLKEKYPDAQIFLDLKGTTAPLSAVDIARHVIHSFEPNADLRALDESNMSATYQSVLHGKKVLLFFDNARSAEQIAALRQPETCAMLVTSRWSFPVTGLNPHKVGVLQENEAIDFLLELCPRIGDKASDLARACSYLPLALRIAGSFLQVNTECSIEKYLTQLSDRKQRLTTLRESREDAELITEPDLLATFELSYGQLSEDNQKRWRVLGVFPSSFVSTAAEDMWELEEDESVKVLGLLRRYSLLDFDETSSRYTLHDLLADYAIEKLNSREMTIARLNHSIHYSKLLTDINQDFINGGEGISRALQLYDIESLNIVVGQQSSVEYLESNDDAIHACNNYALQGSINGFRQGPHERIGWLENGLKASKLIGNPEFICSHLGNLGATHAEFGYTDKAIKFLEQALTITREVGFRQGEGNVLGNLGVAYGDLGDMPKAIDFYEQALAITREINDRLYEGIWLDNLGNAHARLGQRNTAIEFYKKRLVLAHEIDDLLGESNTLANLGAVDAEMGNIDAAIKFFNQGLGIARDVGDRRVWSLILGNLGSAHAQLGELHEAIKFFEQALSIADGRGERRNAHHWLENICASYQRLGNYQATIRYYEEMIAIDR